MHCPFCNSEDTKVLETRVNNSTQVKRRRECIVCSERFNTLEMVDLVLPRIIKTDNSRETFKEDKLRQGFFKALEKRPVADDKIETSIQNIKHKLRLQTEKEVKSELLGEWVMNELKSLDKVAYIRFASVYRQFQDVEAFKAEIDKLIDK